MNPAPDILPFQSGPKVLRGRTRFLAVLDREPRDINVTYHAETGVLEFRPKSSRTPFFCPLGRIWDAYSQNVSTVTALDDLQRCAKRVEDSRQLVFGHSVLPSLVGDETAQGVDSSSTPEGQP